jgi:hypothetical protein
LSGTEDSAGPRVDRENPWPGLAPFTEADAGFFHGRDSEIRTLLQLVGREDLVLLYGVSGLGKTSLLRAGLSPQLPSSILPVYIRLHFAASAQDRGAVALRHEVLAALQDAARKKSIELPSEAKSGTLWEYFRRRDQPLWGRGNEIVVPLLVFDQFEQLFTRQPDPDLTREDLDAFLEDLGDVVGGRVPRWLEDRLQSPATVDRYIFESTACKVILSFREEYLADVKRLRTLVQWTDRNSLRLEPMRERNAIAAVRGAGGHLLTPLASASEANSPSDVAAAIVAQVAEKTLSDDEGAVDPAILSVFCTELNVARLARARTGGSPLIDLGLVADNKSDQIIGNFYRRAVASVPDAVRRFIEDRLVLPSRTRNSVAQEEMKHLPGGAIAALIDSWRILRREVVGRQQQVRIELTHDVLVAPVMQDKQRRIDEQRLRPARRRQLLMGAGAAAVVVMLLAGLGFYLAAEFERSQDRARRAAQLQDSQPLDALLLAIAAAESAHTIVAEQVLRSVVDGTYPRAVLQTRAAIVDGDFGGPANQFVTLSNDGRVHKWDLTTGRISTTQDGHDGALSVRVMADGSVVTMAPDRVRVWHSGGNDRIFKIDDGDIFAFDRSSKGLWCGVSRLGGPSVFWNLGDGKKVTAAAPSRIEPLTIAFDATGRLLLETGLSGHLRLLDATTGTVLATHHSTDALEHGALSGDGRLVAVTGAQGTALFDVASDGLRLRGRLEPAMDADAARAGTKVIFNADHSRVLSIGPGGVLVWDTTSGAATTSVIDRDDRPYLDAALGPDGMVAVATATGAGLRTATDFRPFAFHTREVQRVVFAPDGRSVATIAKDGFAAIWDVDTAATPSTMPFDELLERARSRVPVGLLEDYWTTLLSR